MNWSALTLKLTTVFAPAPEGGYTCHFEVWPGIFSEGETIDQAKSNLLAPSRRSWSFALKFQGHKAGRSAIANKCAVFST